MEGRDLIQCLNGKKVEYQASLDISEDCTSLAVFIKPNYRDHIKFDKET